MPVSSIQIVGVLNTTPDSYFDGGQYLSIDAAVLRAGEMLQQGADIIDIGGESTGPRSVDVSEVEELQRTIPTIKAIHEQYPKAILSIDTTKSAVAKQAIEHGVSIVNDVSAGRHDPEMFSVVAKAGVPIVLMYSKDPTPRTTIDPKQYDDVIHDIVLFFDERIESAKEAGIARDKIILDPGLGHFVSSDPQYSFEIIARLKEIVALGLPVFISPSRKSFLEGSEKLPTIDRLPGTIAASALCTLNGASYIRTHDVLPVRRGCEIALAVARK